jgi:hypothetical protein
MLVRRLVPASSSLRQCCQFGGFYPKTGAFSMNGGISEGFLIFRVKQGLFAFEAKNLDHLDGDGRKSMRNGFFMMVKDTL